MIYLAWGFEYTILIMIATIVFWAGIVPRIKITDPDGNKKPILNNTQVFVALLISIVVLMLTAFRVGVKQEYLDRQAFDATAPTVRVEKVEVVIPNRDSVRDEFQKEIQKSKERNQ